MAAELTGKMKKTDDIVFFTLLGITALMVVFAVALQPDKSLLTGFWAIQTGHAALITDPICTGGAGAALLNAAVLMLGSVLLVRGQKMPFTGFSLACIFMVTGFSLMGKNVLNSMPIFFGGLLYAFFKRESFTKYTYLTLFATCLSPLVSYLSLHLAGWVRYPAAVLCGLVIGFVMPAVSGYTVRIHQGYNLYNVGFSAGFVGLAVVSLLKGFGLEFHTTGSWSEEQYLLLPVLVCCVLAGLLLVGVAAGCRSWGQYKRILRHSGRAVADFLAIDGLGVTFVNMALVGAIGFAYLLVLGVPLNGPLLCGIFSMIGFAAFGKHPKNVVPVMAGAALTVCCMGSLSLTARGVLLATLFSTSLAPIAGQFGWYWGVAAGVLHMAIVQNTSVLHAGMNLYNNGFSAGLTCIIMIPLIEALKKEPEE